MQSAIHDPYSRPWYLAQPAAEPLLHICIDADACPVKQDVYRVAERCRLNVTLQL